MRARTLWIGTVIGLILYLAIAWGLGLLLKLKGSDLAMLGGGLSLLGIAAAGLLLWFMLPKTAAGSSTGDGSPDDLDAVVAAARAHLAASPVAKRADMNRFPMIVVLGPGGAAKTTTIVRSGLEPELLAGAVYKGDAVIPTASANLWYSSGAVFFDTGGAVSADPAAWAKVTEHATPRRFAAAFTGRAQAPRAALVCVSCEDLIKPGATPGALARPLGERLAALAKKLGVKLPVYVIFTKADRVPYFADYVRNFTAEEAREPLGVSLPADSGVVGSYADRVSPRLNNEFQTLFQSLAARRVEMLPREHGNEYKPGAYEFPREFRKLGPPVVEFLLELCKPSALQVNPFLRGFYFTGVQAIVIQDVAPAAVGPQSSAPALAANATNVFARQQAAAAAAPAAAARGARRVPRWVFLDRLLRDIVLADDAALAATRAGARIDALRRTALTLATAACLVLAIGWTVSFSGNRALEDGARDAARAVAVLPAVGADLANIDALTRLDSLGAYMTRLGDYERNGVPLHLTWGLYTGNSLFPAVRAAYFDGFSRVMFDGTRTNLAAVLRNLPAAPRPTDDYATVYNHLEAYLITTNEWKRSTAEFLTPVLMTTWLSGRSVDSARMQLARRQFDRYATELALANPYAGGADLAVVQHSRTFLSQFAVADQIYQFRVIEASRVIPGIQFNKQFPGSAGALVDTYSIPGAFTAAGWASMQNSIANVDKLLAGDAWVLGNDTTMRVDRAKLQNDLKQRYAADYVKTWRGFLNSASVLRFDGLGDASRKLLLLSGNQSPLLELLQVTAQNTVVDTSISGIFQPAAFVAPPGTADKLVGDKNSGYINALLTLQNNVQMAATAPAGQNGPAVDQARQSAGQAALAATQLAQGFRVGGDAAVASTVQRLLQNPVDFSNGLLRVVGKGPANAAGAGFCAVAKSVLAKYPFTPTAKDQASATEVASVFAPQTGALWKMYDGSLQALLIKQGNDYIAAPSSAVAISPAFVAFFNRAAAVSAALFRTGGALPELDITLRPVAIPDALPQVTVSMDNAVVPFSKRNPGPSQFIVNPSTGKTASVTAKVNGQDLTLLEASGPWAGFQILQQADAWRSAGPSSNFDWALHSGPGTIAQLPNGTPIKFTFELSSGDAPAIMKPGYFSGFACVPVVAP